MPRLPQIWVPLWRWNLHTGLPQGCGPSTCVLHSGSRPGSALSPLGTLDMLSEPAWFVWVHGSPCSQEGVGHCSIYFCEIETSDLRMDVPEDRRSRRRQGKIQCCLRSAQDSGLAGWPLNKTPRGVCAPELHLQHAPCSLPAHAQGPVAFGFPACPSPVLSVRCKLNFPLWQCFSKQLISSQTNVTFPSVSSFSL